MSDLAYIGSRRSGDGRWREFLTIAALLLVLAFAAYVRAAYADEFASFDELWALALTTGHGTPFGQFGTDVIDFSPRSQTSLADKLPLSSVWGSMGSVLHPPLYFVSLRFWRVAFGEGEAVARAYSNLWSLVAIAFAFATARATFGRAIALLVALTLALSPTQVYLAQEIRGYSMLVAIASAGLWLMTRVELAGPTRAAAVALGLVPLALVSTHYFAFGSAIGVAVFGLWRLGPHRRAFAATVVATAAVYAAAWLPVALRQVRSLSTGDSYLVVAQRAWPRELAYLAGAPMRQLIDRPLDQDRVFLLMGAALVVPWLLLRRLPAMRPAAVWLCATLGGLLALDVARQTELMAYVRYTSAATPAVLPLLIGCAWAWRRRAAYAVAGAMALATGIYLHANVGVAADSPGFGLVAREVASRVGPGDAVLTYRGPGPAYAGQAIQLHLSHVPGLFPRPIADLSRPMTPDMVAQLPPRAWLVIVGEPTVTVEALVPGARVAWGRGVDIGINLYQLEIPTAPAGTSRPSTTGVSAPAR